MKPVTGEDNCIQHENYFKDCCLIIPEVQNHMQAAGLDRFWANA